MEWIYSAIPPCGSFDWTKRKEVPGLSILLHFLRYKGQYWDGFTICLQILLTPLLWRAVYLCPPLLLQPHGIWAKHSDLFITSRWLSWQPLLKSQLTASINYWTQEERHLPVISAPKPARPPPNCQVTPNLRGLNLLTWGSRSHGAKFHEQHRTVVLMPLRFGVACYIAVVTRTDLQRPVFFIFQSNLAKTIQFGDKN